MNRKLLGLVAVAAVLALIVGVSVGRNLISSEAALPQKPDVIRVKDAASGTSIAYPGAWTALPRPEGDGDLVLSVKRDDDVASFLVRTSKTDFAEEVTLAGLPVVRQLTDDLLAADDRVKLLRQPNTVELGGLPGWRYQYTFGSAASGGAHDHYFLFKKGLLIQIVFQAQPKERLKGLLPDFERIAATFRGNDA